MYYILKVIIPLLMVTSFSIAQDDVWVHVEKGVALFLNPKSMDWEPIVGKQQLPMKTYALTKDGTVFKVFKETEVFQAPSSGYFFLADIFLRNRVQVVEELTFIEAQQLPPSIKSDTTDEKRIVGLTYGIPSNHSSSELSIPYFKERTNAVNWFYKQKRYDAALLSLKRTMTQFPILCLNQQFTDLLCTLYEKMELFGFLYEETNRLMVMQKEGEFESMILKWNDLAKKKLTKR